NRKPVRASLEAGIDLLRPEVDNAALHRNLAVGCERQFVPDSGNDTRKFFGTQRRRRAAAKIDRMDRPAPQGSRSRFASDLIEDMLDIRGRCGRRISIAVESAKKAMVGAERHMDIDEAFVRGTRPVDK